MTVRVARKVAAAEDIALFELVHPAGLELAPFSAGSHIDVEVKEGLIRQYSLCNDPAERNRYVIGVLKDPATRGGSATMHALVQGQSIRISEPRNHFALDPAAKRSLLFAGGIGITPILCMAQSLTASGADFEMHYGVRSRARCAFYDWIVTSPFAGRVQFHFDDGHETQKLNIDAALGSPDRDTHLYVCGPAAYIDFVLTRAAAKGFADQQVHREYFKVDTPAVPVAGGAFQVRIASTGQVFDIPADRTVLEVLLSQGLDVPFSCEQGVCGTCLTRVLEGVPEHRDFYLTEAEHARNDQFTPCCSRSRTPVLVLGSWKPDGA